MKQYKSKVAAPVFAFLTSTIFTLLNALHYAHAARCDEHKGFEYTAAMEWRHAAELFNAKTISADYCWRQWERIIHLPRRLAGTICEPQYASCMLHSCNNTVAYDMPTSTAASSATTIGQTVVLRPTSQLPLLLPS